MLGCRSQWSQLCETGTDLQLVRWAVLGDVESLDDGGEGKDGLLPGEESANASPRAVTERLNLLSQYRDDIGMMQSSPSKHCETAC